MFESCAGTWLLTKSWILNNILAISLIIFFLTSVRCVCAFGGRGWVVGGGCGYIYVVVCVCRDAFYLSACLFVMTRSKFPSYARACACACVHTHKLKRIGQETQALLPSCAAKHCCQALLPSTAAKSLTNTHVHIINTQTLYANIDTQTSSPTPSLAYTHRMLDRANRTHRPPTHGRSHTFIVPA